MDLFKITAARAAILSFVLLLSACGGGGGDGGGGGGGTPAPAPSGLSYSPPPGLRMNTPMNSLSPSVSGTVTSYSVNPSLPPGLNLNATTGVISGTPTEPVAQTNYTITARNASGTSTFVLSLRVFTLAVQTNNIVRLAANGVSINPGVIVRPINIDVGILTARAVDTAGFILPEVQVIAGDDGRYTLLLTSNPSVSPGLFSGAVTLNLCRDTACTTPLEEPSVSVPFEVRVLGSNSEWPGDHTTTLTAWEGVSDWAMFQGNASHTGFVPATVDPDAVTPRWRSAGYQVPSTWTPYRANLATADGLFYAVTSNYMDGGVLYAKREHDGSEVWRRAFADPANPPAVKNGAVYLATGHQEYTQMFGLAANDGSVLFSAPMTSQWETYFAPTIGPNGMVYANGGTYGGMYAFNPAGNQLFFVYQAQVSNWSPAVDANYAYSYTGGVLRVHDVLTGSLAREIVDPMYMEHVGEHLGSPVLGSDGSITVAHYSRAVLASSTGNSLSNFRVSDGTIAWRSTGAYPTTPGYRAGVVYATNNMPFRLEARAESDGDLLWEWSPSTAVGDTAFVSEVIVTNNLAFVSTDRATYAVDLETHRPVFSYPAAGKLALSANGVLYIQNADFLTALNLK